MRNFFKFRISVSVKINIHAIEDIITATQVDNRLKKFTKELKAKLHLVIM